MVGTPHGRALTEQALEVRTDKRAPRLYAPVSSRGEAVGVLELWLAREPDAETLAAVSAAAHALAYVGDREPTLHGSFRVGPAVPCRSHSRRRSSTACCRARIRVRRGSSRSRVGSSRVAISAATLSTSAWNGTRCTCR